MQSSTSTDPRVESAIYLVGGLVIFLWGFQMITSIALTLYNALVPGPAPAASSHFWVDESVAIFVDVVILFAGLFLFALAWRAHRRSRSSGMRDPTQA